MAASSTSSIYDRVQDHYSTIAKGATTSNDQNIAKHFGYDTQDLHDLPEGANLGLSCGNPLAVASLQPGETVIDLGSGAGFDVFQAAKQVGSTGKAIGLDHNDDMLLKAKRNLDKTRLDNVQFVKSSITDVLMPNECADCIISNCVINLVPEDDKHAVFKEMFRLLKPGGRVAISDILARKMMPEHIRQDVALYVGCIAGASSVAQYERYLREAGFVDVNISGTQKSINVYKDASEANQSCCASSSEGGNANSDIDFDEWAGSFKIFASKVAKAG